MNMSTSSPLSKHASEVFEAWADLTSPIGHAIVDWMIDGTKVKTAPTKGWLLVDFPSAAAVLLGYLTFVAIGTVVMRLLPGSGVKFPATSFAYNIIQVALCSYMCIEAALLAQRNKYSLVCNRMLTTDPPLAKLLWMFYLSKVLDFADTFFIVMGKKWRQLSFLHVYHHTTIFGFYWLNSNVNYDGDVYLTIILNGAIHMMMYAYYFLSIHTRDIWWKKYLTSAQLVQFTCMVTQAGVLLSGGKQCSDSPPRVTAIYSVYIASLFALFMHFFIQSYTSKPAKKELKAKDL
uniref:Elongation of fatty acids protein n=1 Tax=Haptolina brevifila TaxID=156173 RepID=A0A7S2N461_9EUKA|mmetsp:Transcript_65841/g.130515  ORF Transcript_65841/g.130515 Transcript_65841/m.130515 type:complete len:290 (+) Transcript_65841:89-958(+)